MAAARPVHPQLDHSAHPERQKDWLEDWIWQFHHIHLFKPLSPHLVEFEVDCYHYKMKSLNRRSGVQDGEESHYYSDVQCCGTIRLVKSLLLSFTFVSCWSGCTWSPPSWIPVPPIKHDNYCCTKYHVSSTMPCVNCSIIIRQQKTINTINTKKLISHTKEHNSYIIRIYCQLTREALCK